VISRSSGEFCPLFVSDRVELAARQS